MQSPGGSSSSRSRRSTTTTAAKNGVIAGSVWENRMKVDEVKGGIKVFNGGDQNNAVGGGGGTDHSGNQIQVYRRRLPRIQSSNGNGGGGEIGKSKRLLKPDTIDGNDQKNPIQLRKSKSDNIEKTPIPVIKKTRSHGEQRNSSAIKDREIILNNGSQSANQKKNVIDYDCDDEEEEEEGSNLNDEETENEEIDVKEVNIDQEQLRLNVMIKNEEDSKTQMSKELVVVPSNLLVGNLKNSPSKSEKVVICQDEKKLNEIQKAPIPISSGVSKRPPPPPQPVKKYTETHPKIPPTGSYEFQRCPGSQNKLQNLVDLVMWRDVSKSALVFGFGAFLILSSSFTKDLNFSLISAISYLGLLYLATRFLYTSIICRGAAHPEVESNETLLVGEDEAVWLLRLILPYLNEFLLKLKSLFSGDPATTMKLGVLLFILARCGSSITICKVAKLGFFGIFTVPKVCSSYSTQLTGYGKFWIRRFQDAWDSCTHKKAVALAGFTLVWNLSSIVARIWAVFMLIVAVRFYQQSLVLLNERWEEEEMVALDGDDSNERHDCVTTTTSIKQVVLEEGKKRWVK
ncbi:reticulon-like protein B21 isoform X1 [Papaver somniferum]|uniref:reticulon-like protein B21 isoform X1 n=1 Tax=Papaver somniferum TaxID=3469 RepID=UPI000E6FC076|nr:reticulon-like protein B21 isoform X1 [Papaver somniferum]